MRALLAMLLLVPLAGCADEEVAEHEVAVFYIELTGGSSTHQFEIASSSGYWRTDLMARARESVTYSAVGPDGARHNSTAGAGFPFEHSLRVESPAPGTWTLTVSARSVVDGTLRILVPD